MRQRLAKTKTRIDHDAFARDACRLCRSDAFAQECAHLGDDILILRLLLHVLRLALLVHQTHRRIAAGNHIQRTLRPATH